MSGGVDEPCPFAVRCFIQVRLPHVGDYEAGAPIHLYPRGCTLIARANVIS